MGRRPGSVRPEAMEWPERFCQTEQDRRAVPVLLSLASVTPRRLLELAGEFGTAVACLAAVKRGEAGSDADRSLASTIRPEDVTARLDAAGARLVVVHDPEYPKQLLDLFDPPAGLFVRGQPLDTCRAPVAIVGARNCSPGGAETASILARALAACGTTVVSGGARGIDAAAHVGAVQARGRTAVVVGCGIDVVYPRQNRRLFESILADGSIVGEYPPGTRAEPFRFPARNRIVAALSRAVIVVEGASGSGSLITAEHALDLGRDVFAVPGPVTAALAQAPLALIRDGATMIRGPDDLLSDLGLEPLGTTPGGGDTEAASPAGTASAPALTSGESAVWQALTTPSAPDRLASVAALPLVEVVAALVGLELRGLVRQVAGRYERTSGPANRPRPE
jgi:DNA processing protein